MKMRHRIHVLASVAIAVAFAALVPAMAGAAPSAPSADPFYTWSGSLAHVAPGTVLRSRTVQINPDEAPDELTGTQVLYRTTNQLGQPSATVATIIEPVGRTATKLVSYQTFYDGVADTCRPSYTLQGGAGPQSTGNVDVSSLLAYAEAGYAVITADYEGPTDDYGAGRESGMNVLDGIRAAEHQLGLRAKTTPVGMVGYSGGSTATEWASERQPAYAPELDIVGSAEGGIPVDFTHNLAYIGGSLDWAGAIPSVMVGLTRAYQVDFSQYLNAVGQQDVAAAEQGCLNPFADPGLTFAEMLKPQYQNWKQVPIFRRIFNDSIMGNSGTPTSPLFMLVGNYDGTGDGVMVAADVQQLAHEYCARRVPVDLQIDTGADHYAAAGEFEPQALAFLKQRFADAAPTNGCASIGPGDPLTPIPAAPASTSPRGVPSSPALHLVGVSVRSHGVRVALRATTGVLHHVVVRLLRGRRGLARATLARVGTRTRRILLRVRGHKRLRGHYTLVISVAHTRVFQRSIVVRAAAR